MEERKTESSETDAHPGNSLEDSLRELQQIVERMESGNQSLETSLDEFERGIKLVRECQRILEEAEQRVHMLTGKEGKEQTAPFPTPPTE